MFGDVVLKISRYFLSLPVYVFVCSQVLLQVEIYEIEGNIFRLKIDEASPLRARYKVSDVLIKEPTTQR